MSTARAPCPDCGLPYYTERHSDCPYCEAASTDAADAADEWFESSGPPADSVARERPPERPRVTCSNCGLPHYADDGGGCPYCAAAGAVGESEVADERASAESGPTASAADGETGGRPDASAASAPGDRTADEGRSRGILGRLRSLFSL